MTERKTKLVCVGWGILKYRQYPGCYIFGNLYYTRRQAIKEYEKESVESYKNLPRDNAIAKKLWVEVKNERPRQTNS